VRGSPDIGCGVASNRPKVGLLDDPVWSEDHSDARTARPAVVDHPLRLVWLALVAVGLVALALIGAWRLTGLQRGYSATIFAVGVAIFAAIILLLIGQWLVPDRNLAPWFCELFGVGGCLLVVFAAWNGSLLQLKMKTSEPSWTKSVNQALGSQHGGCVDATTTAVMPGIGLIDLRCVTLAGRHNHIQVSLLHQGTRGSSGVLYMPSSLDLREQRDQCLLHLDGPWWQISSLSEGGCPSGFQFIPGG
jgi:hypothetical protein